MGHDSTAVMRHLLFNQTDPAASVLQNKFMPWSRIVYLLNVIVDYFVVFATEVILYILTVPEKLTISDLVVIVCSHISFCLVY